MEDSDIARLLANNRGPSIYDLPKFLSTAAGRYAVRGAVDQAIAVQRTTNSQPQPMSQQVIKSLLASIGGPNGYQVQNMQSSNNQTNQEGVQATPDLRNQTPVQDLRGGY